YGFGSGMVIYSSIPLDYYLQGSGSIPAFADIYAPNVIAYAASLAHPVPLDFGDAPAPYPTLLSQNGARHVITGSGPFLGNVPPDAESNGQPNSAATGDDNDGLDDEDGVTTVLNATGGAGIAQVKVSGAPGLLDAWIDFDKD